MRQPARERPDYAWMLNMPDIGVRIRIVAPVTVEPSYQHEEGASSLMLPLCKECAARQEQRRQKQMKLGKEDMRKKEKSVVDEPRNGLQHTCNQISIHTPTSPTIFPS